MKLPEHLLTILGEECAEVQQRISKALRFGLDEVQPGQLLDNADRIREEYAHVMAAYDLLIREGLLLSPSSEQIAEKKDEILERWIPYAKECGALT